MKENIICDTNIFIHYAIDTAEVVEALEKIGNAHILVPVTVAMELSKGCRNKKEANLLMKHLKAYKILYIDARISQKAFELIQTYHLSHALQIPDALIAATGLVYDLPIYTYNKKDFTYIENIRLYEP